MKKLKFIIPFLGLFILCALLAKELFYAKPHELPSALIGENVPHFELPVLTQSNFKFTSGQQLVGRVSLLNVWASWCSACAIEQPMLMKIKSEYHIPIFGIAYKDTEEDAKKWLQKMGNPYVLIGNDSQGDTAIDLGVYGTPETFIISRQGKIVYRHIGVIDQKAWDEVLYPLIRKYENEA